MKRDPVIPELQSMHGWEVQCVSVLEEKSRPEKARGCLFVVAQGTFFPKSLGEKQTEYLVQRSYARRGLCAKGCKKQTFHSKTLRRWPLLELLEFPQSRSSH